MGVFSEMSMEQEYGDSPASVSIVPSVSAEPEAPAWDEPAETVLPAFEEEPHQQTEPETAPDTLIQVNGAPDGEQTVPQGSAAAEISDDTVAEDDKRKAHEAAEAKRKAEFDARQAAKKAAEQEQLDRLAAMSDDELLEASMKRVNADTEKLTRRNMMECVAEYIQTMCIEDPSFTRKVMHPRKTMIRCYQYINRKAWEYVQDELKAKNITPSRNDPYASAIPEGVCYQWAVDYFNDPDAKEDHEEEEKFVPKPYTGGTSKGKSGKTAKGKAGDKKADTSKKTAAKVSPKKPAEDDGQFSLGDFMMPEEKAG